MLTGPFQGIHRVASIVTCRTPAPLALPSDNHPSPRLNGISRPAKADKSTLQTNLNLYIFATMGLTDIGSCFEDGEDSLQL